MKTKKILASLAFTLTALIFVSCGQNNGNDTSDKGSTEQNQNKTDNENTDATTTASIVDNNEAFEKAIRKDGTWIIATLNDLTFDKELVVDGDFKNGKKDESTSEELFQRKIALYTQDENRNITNKFTLTAPKLTFNSINGSIEHGTFKGDLYISGKNFKLVNQVIEGNIYFLNQEAMDTFKIEDKDGDTPSKVTGVQELKTE